FSRGANQAIIAGALLPIRVESDAAFWGNSFRPDELPDCMENGLKLAVIFFLEFVDTAFQSLIAKGHLLKSHENSDDRDGYLNCTVTSEDRGQHRDALFRKRVGSVLRVFPTAGF